MAAGEKVDILILRDAAGVRRFRVPVFFLRFLWLCPLILAVLLAGAVYAAYRLRKDNLELAGKVRGMHAELDAAGTRYKVLSPPTRAWPILAVSFAGLRGETLVNALSAESIYIASGSACSSRRGKGNRVLTAMGFDAATVLGAVRISFARTNTTDEIHSAARAINTAWRRLARP